MEQFELRESSNLKWARFDELALEIDFKNAKGIKVSTYRYDGTRLDGKIGEGGGFPRSVWQQFKAAAEPGKFFAYHVRPIFKGIKIWSLPK